MRGGGSISEVGTIDSGNDGICSSAEEVSMVMLVVGF